MNERRQVDHRRLETFRRYAANQSAQLEESSQAERQYLQRVAKAEADASRQELIVAQSRFDDSPSQQLAQVCYPEKAFLLTPKRAAVQSERACRVCVSESEIYNQMFGR